MADSKRLSFIYIAPVANRWLALDGLRGVAIFFMILANFLANYKILPAWLWHAAWNGLTIADLGVPIFLVALGISYKLSFAKRINQFGKLATIVHFLKRYLTLFIFGLGGFWLVMGRYEWEVLQLIGAVGIFSLGFMFLKPELRFLIASLILIFYQLSILNGASSVVMSFVKSGLGGPYATLAWGFIVLFSSSLANWIKDNEPNKIMKILIFWGLTLTLLGILVSFIIPFNKHLVSISYVLFTTGITIGGLLLFHALAEIKYRPIPIFGAIGRNALICYITSQLLTVGLTKLLPSKVAIFFLFTSSLIVLLICVCLAQILDTKKIYLRL